MTLARTLNRAAVHALRVPGPHVPGWFPLVADRAHRLVGPDRGPETAEILGSRMRLDIGEYMQRRYYYHCYEAPEVRFFAAWLRPGDVVLDVGAHVGLFTLYAARLVGPAGEVHGFEPVPANHERLAANVALNGYEHVRLNRVAAGDREGEVSLGLHQERLVGASTCDYSVGGKLSSVTAPLITLDRYIAEHVGGRVRMAKIDVEGLEPQVLDGLAHTFDQVPPDALMFELNAKMLLAHASSPTAVLERLTSNGYRLHRLDRRGRLAPAPGAAGLEEAARRWNFDNEPASVVRVGLGTRETLFNAVAVHADATRA